MRSSSVHRSVSVHSFAFIVQSALEFTVHKALSFAHIVLKAFSHFHSDLHRERIVLKPSVQNSDRIRKERNFIVNYEASGLLYVTIQTIRIRNFINTHKKSSWSIIGTAAFFSEKMRSISFICLHYKLLPLIYIIIC